MADTGSAAIRVGADIETGGEEIPQIPAEVGAVTYDRIVVDFDADEIEFVVGEFHEAVDAFRDKVPRLRANMNGLARQSAQVAADIITAEANGGAIAHLVQTSKAINLAMRESFFITDASKETIRAVKGLLASYIEEGDPEAPIPDLAEFIDEAQARGAMNLTRVRLETVFRNNLQAAYNDGRIKQAEDPEVRRFFPLLMIDSIRDNRTRGNPAGLYPDRGVHWQMDGYINTAEEMQRLGLVPPNGHNCRCTTSMVSQEKAELLGLLFPDGSPDPDAINAYNGARATLIESRAYPDPGFRPAITPTPVAVGA